MEEHAACQAHRSCTLNCSNFDSLAAHTCGGPQWCCFAGSWAWEALLHRLLHGNSRERVRIDQLAYGGEEWRAAATRCLRPPCGIQRALKGLKGSARLFGLNEAFRLSPHIRSRPSTKPCSFEKAPCQPQPLDAVRRSILSKE